MPLTLTDFSEPQKKRVSELNLRLQKFQTPGYLLDEVLNIDTVSSLTGILAINAFADKESTDEMYQMKVLGSQILLGLYMAWSSLRGYNAAVDLGKIVVEGIPDDIFQDKYQGNVDAYLDAIEQILSVKEKTYSLHNNLVKPILYVANVGLGFKINAEMGVVNLLALAADCTDKLPGFFPGRG